MIAFDFSDKVAFITGGTSGIGLATARAFADAGAAVVLAARSADAGARACAELGARTAFVATDVRDAASLSAAVDRCVAQFGRLDIAFNCAGAGGDMAPLEAASQAVWDDVLAINARGSWLAMRYEIPAMLAAGGGAIVNMSSIYGTAGKAAHHAYVASKHAVLGMTRSLALEYATRGVRINALCAGITATPSLKAAEVAMPDLVSSLVAEHPMGRMASEAEIAGSVLWLCSEAAGYVTGAAIAVDGGFSAA
ncbi:MAG TPA: SDR family oxidoreductase [Polyangiales bacterium]|nr:SDR family oxidoreductase [Polyangiales bacterium]